MNILFLHGLESKLNFEKRSVLEAYGKVAAPDLDYFLEPDTIRNLYDRYSDKNINVVIGSSMGGFAGFYLAQMLQVPALLFNPALQQQKVTQHIPPRQISFKAPVRLVLGELDNIVSASQTQAFVMKHYVQEANLSIRLVPELQHTIPFPVFRREVADYFKDLSFPQ